MEDYKKIKAQMCNLDLDYKDDLMSIESQTNNLINKVMTNFIESYKDLNVRNVVVYYNDDLLSLIAYKIILNVREVCPFKFNLWIKGKKKKTKKYLPKEAYGVKTFLNFKKKILKESNTIYISPLNILYKIINEKYYNKISELNNRDKVFYPLIKFTPQEIETTADFYQINESILPDKKTKNYSNIEKNISDLKRLCNGQYYIEDFSSDYSKDICLVKLENDIEKDNKTLNEVEQTDNIVYYFGDSPILYDYNFRYYIKNKTNLPIYNNLNVLFVLREFAKDSKVNFIFVGDWTNKEKYRMNYEIYHID